MQKIIIDRRHPDDGNGIMNVETSVGRFSVNIGRADQLRHSGTRPGQYRDAARGGLLWAFSNAPHSAYKDPPLVFAHIVNDVLNPPPRARTAGVVYGSVCVPLNPFDSTAPILTHPGMATRTVTVREDWRITGSRRDQWSLDRMMTPTQWQEWREELGALIDWCKTELYPYVRPGIPSDVQRRFEHVQAAAVTARSHWKLAEERYLAITDEIAEITLRLAEWQRPA